MRAEVRRVLNVIDEALVKQDEAAADLWVILAALRGYDGEWRPDFDKDTTTARIRGAAFPKLYEKNGGDEAFYGPRLGDYAPLMSGKTAERIKTPQESFDVKRGGDHFRNHYNRAVDAINATDDPPPPTPEPGPSTIAKAQAGDEPTVKTPQPADRNGRRCW